MQFFIDVDDVVADFKGHAIARGVPPWTGTFYANHPDTWTEEQKTQVRMVDALCADETFWRDIPVARGAFEIIAMCALHRETFLLTAYPPGNIADPMMIERVKLQWAMDKVHFPHERTIICERKAKIQYACRRTWDGRKPNVLIDDAEKNVLEWREAGGIAIHHMPDEGPEETLRQIKALL